jgi:hypothetical protein
LFSKGYITQLQSLHGDTSRPQGFGGKVKKLGKFHDYMKEWNPTTLLDYGCGKGHILEHLGITYPNTQCEGYDPAVPFFSEIKRDTYECVFSNDVLEHIEPEFLDEVLHHIDKLSTRYVWLRIDTHPARKFLPDGRNAHISLHDDDWWMEKLEEELTSCCTYYNLDKKGKFDVAFEKTNA